MGFRFFQGRNNMLGMIGPNEWLIVLLVILVLFGGKKIPELMGGLGKGVRNFKKSMNEDDPKEEAKPQQIEKSKEGETKA